MFHQPLKSLAYFLLVVILVTALSGCTQQQEEDPQPEDDSAVVQEIIAGLGRDPGEMYGYGAHPPLTRVLEPLLEKDLELGLKPALAENWEVSDDELTWSLQLREGVEFHDGTSFDAEAVVHNLHRIDEMSPGQLGPVENIEAEGQLEVQVTHSEPFAPFPYALSWPGAAMISPGAVDDDGNVEEPVGTGPYKRENWVPDEEMVLVKNENYWGGAPTLEKITLDFIPDPTTRIMALEKGEIDMIIDTGGVLPEQVPTLEMHDQVEVLSVEGAVPHYMSLNTQKPPLDEPEVREALVRALDPESIVEHALEGYGRVMTSVIPYSEEEWMHSDGLYSFNEPSRAREFLEEAGWEDKSGDGILQKDGQECRVEILLSSALVGRWPYQTMAEVMQAQLQDVGIDSSIEVVETGLWQEKLREGEVHISMRPWAGVSPQSRLLDWLHSEGENTRNMGTFYNSQEMDSLTEELMRTTDEEEARELALQIQELAAEDVPIIPLYDEVLINAVRDHVKGYTLHPWFTVNWEDIYVEK